MCMYTYRTLDPEELAPVWQEINSIDQSFGPRVNHRIPLKNCLAHVDSIVAPLIEHLNSTTGYPARLQVFRSPRRLRLEDLWVNFVGPGQATPPHNHGGVISFCLWLQIPYTRDSELAACPWIPEVNNTNGLFTFQTVGQQGITNQTLIVDQAWEGRVAVWPADVYHMVMPYYSTQALRISVAGNYWFDV